MTNDINLVSQNLGVSSKESKRVKRLKIVAVSSIFAVGILSIFLFLLNHVFLSPASIISQQSTAIASLSSLGDKQAKLIVVTQRLNDISSLLKTRADYDLVISTVLEQAPFDMSSTSLSVEKGKLSMVVSSKSLLSVNSFLEGLKSMVAKKQFIKNITVDSLIFDSGSSVYNLTFRVDLI